MINVIALGRIKIKGFISLYCDIKSKKRRSDWIDSQPTQTDQGDCVDLTG
jgi:hypothetical protein